MHASLGYITVPTPGTPVQAVAGTPYNGKFQAAHGVMFEVLPDNVGKTYIGKKGMNKTTGENVLAILAPPTTNFYATFSAAITLAPGGLSLNDYYVDAENSDEGVLGTFVNL